MVIMLKCCSHTIGSSSRWCMTATFGFQENPQKLTSLAKWNAKASSSQVGNSKIVFNISKKVDFIWCIPKPMETGTVEKHQSIKIRYPISILTPTSNISNLSPASIDGQHMPQSSTKKLEGMSAQLHSFCFMRSNHVITSSHFRSGVISLRLRSNDVWVAI